METEIGLLRWGMLLAQVNGRKTTNKEKYKILKKKKREVKVL